jgi:hypothetical protein
VIPAPFQSTVDGLTAGYDGGMSEAFDEPPNRAVITIRQIVREGQPVLHVTHDLDDHGWQFLGAGDAKVEDAMIVALSEMLSIDPTLSELADLPPGWHAWRASAVAEWIRERNDR